MRDTIIETITVESATVTAGRDGDRWKIMAQVPSLKSRYPIGPLWKDVVPGEMIKQGDVVTVELQRGNQKSNTTGQHEYDFFWELDQWGTDKAPTPTPAASAPAPTASGGSGYEDRGRQIAWNSAVNNAVHLYGPFHGDGPVEESWRIITEYAGRLYDIIIAGPPDDPAWRRLG